MKADHIVRIVQVAGLGFRLLTLGFRVWLFKFEFEVSGFRLRV